MKKICVVFVFVALFAATLRGQNQIAAYEYWFNNNYTGATKVSVTPATKINLKESIDASSLANGVHVFNIRFLDTANLWSSVLSQFFYKAPQSSTQNHEIVSYEYWFNNDYANAVSRIATGQVFTLDSLLDASSISLGVHTFNIRFKDNSGLWSSVVSQFFYKAPQSTVAQTEIIEYEYWFDNDYAASQKFSVANQQSFLLSDKLNASSVSDGLHVLSIRFRDNQGLWSSAISQFFYKIPVKEVSDNKIVAYKYWFDNDLEGTSFVSVNPPQKHFNLNDKISLIEIPKGRYSINFQFQDSMGLWSSVVSDSIEKLSLPIARFEVIEQNHCDSVEVTFINKSIDADTYEWDFGDGNNSTEENPTHFYSQKGKYDVSLKIQDTVFMKDTSETKMEFIRVYETPEAVIVWEYDSICPNGEVILGGVIGFGNEWSTGLVADSLIVQSPGTYALTSFNVEYPACRSMSDSLVIHVKPLPLSDFTYQTSDTSHLVKFQNLSQNADSYHWNFGDGASSSLISPEHSYSQNGMYDMYLVAINRCGSDTTEAAIDLRYVSAQELMASFGVSVYPNPSRGLFHIDFSAPVSEANIRVYDASGKVIHNQSVSQVSSTSVQIDGVAGFYFIEVRTSEKVMRFKVIKTE